MPAPRTTIRSLLLRAPLAAILLLQVPGARAQPSQAGEYELKAAFLFHFVQFVEWPLSPEASICVGVYGEDPFGPALDKMVRDEKVQGRSLVIRRADRIQSLHDCEVVFIGRSQKAKVAELLEALSDASTLTIGEVEGFAEQGGVINFFLEGRKIRFEINPEAARRRGLKMSSQLLTLGRIVGVDPRSED